VYPEGSFGYWTENWIWGIPLVGASVVFHVIGLAATAWLVHRAFGHHLEPPANSSFYVVFTLVTGLTTMLLALLHGVEAALWGVVYVIVGAVPNYPTGVYHSLALMTTTGSDVTAVDPHWKLLGGIQAIGGWLLFGLSTAFLFAIMERMSPLMPGTGRRG
jgi:hypothetical protein